MRKIEFFNKKMFIKRRFIHYQAVTIRKKCWKFVEKKNPHILPTFFFTKKDLP